MSDPKLWLFDLDKVSDLLSSSALAMAMNIQTNLQEVDLHPALNAYLRTMTTFHFMSSAQGQMNQAMGMSVRVGSESPLVQADSFYTMFKQNYFKAMDKGPQATLTYLQEKQAQRQLAIDSVKYKFAAAHQVNTEMVAALNRAHAEQHAIKVLCDSAMVIAGAVVPVNWVVNTAIGYSYSIICKVVSNTSEARDAEVMAFAASNTIGQSANVAQDMVDNWAKGVDRKRELYEEAKRRSEKLATELAQKIRDFERQSGSNLSGAQAKSIAKTGRALEGAISNVDKTRGSLAAAEEAQSARQVFKQAGTAGRSGVIGVRAAGVLVGLCFILPDALSAVREIKTDWLEDNKR